MNEKAEEATASFPDPETILKEMAKTLSSSNSLSYEAEIEYDDLLPSGQKIKFGGKVSTLVERPGSVYTEFKGDLTETYIWVSENKATVLDLDHNFYSEIEVPENLDNAMDFMMENHDFSLPIADIVHSDPYSSLTGTTTDGIYIGESLIMGKTCSHLAFVGENLDWQIWVSIDEPRLPCRLIITYKQITGAPEYEATFSSWNLSPEIKHGVFKPQIPEGAQKIEFAKKNNKGDKK